MFELVLFLAHVVVVSKVVGGYTTRAYDLEVPGSKPIRIIEADPIWDHPPRRGFKNERADFEHRTIQPTTVKTDKFMDREDSDYDESSSHKLKDFLNNYADKIKSKQPYSGSEEQSDELYLKNDYSTDSSEEASTEKAKPEKSKSWNLLHIDKIPQNPYGNNNNNKWGNKQSSYHTNSDDRKEWVSMEAVPWSMSKISKWHNKPQNSDKLHQYSQNGYYDRPSNGDRYHDYDQVDYGIAKPSFQKPYRPTHRPQSYYGDDDDNDDDDGYYTNNKRPSFSRPSATYGQKVHVSQSFGDAKPWNKPPHKHDNKCGHQSEIITDGLPPNFPDYNPSDYANRRRGSNSDFGATHAFKGDVLPPLNDGKVNMTTSHGGLLQVESTFQSVDEAQKAYVKKERLKNRRKPISIKVKPAISAEFANQYANPQSVAGYRPIPYAAIDNRNDAPDTSSVLAAVGAGMIPAGMALLVPMAMSGRKRRELLLKHHQNSVTSSPYADQIEITLPRSL